MEFFDSNWGKFKKWRTVMGDTTNLIAALGNYMEEEYKVWDADICGDMYADIAVKDGDTIRYFKASYSWWIEPDTEEWIHDEVMVEEVEEQKIRFKFPIINRDWVILKRISNDQLGL